MAYDTQRMTFGPRPTLWVKRLLIANAIAFVLTLGVGYEFVWNWFAFTPTRILTRPWGALTYMFFHGGFFHLLFNMLGLFFFGPPLESRWGSKEFIRFYLVAGVGGVALSFLMAPTAGILGASAAVYGLLVAFAMNWPDAPIYFWGIFPIKAKWLVGGMITLDLVSAITGSGSQVAYFAHLGGVLAAFLYLKSEWRPGAAASGKGKPRAPRRFAIVPRDESDAESAGSHRSGRRARSADRPPAEDKLLDEVDRVLDKISAQGMASLTPKERQLLDEVSKRHRSN